MWKGRGVGIWFNEVSKACNRYQRCLVLLYHAQHNRLHSNSNTQKTRARVTPWPPFHYVGRKKVATYDKQWTMWTPKAPESNESQNESQSFLHWDLHPGCHQWGNPTDLCYLDQTNKHSGWVVVVITHTSAKLEINICVETVTKLVDYPKIARDNMGAGLGPANWPWECFYDHQK
jgi:hypothetical protein